MKLRAVFLACTASIAIVDAVTASLSGRSMTVLSTIFLVICTVGYIIARIAEAWDIKLWEGQ